MNHPWGFNEVHQVVVEAAAERVYRAVRELDMRRSPVIRLLFRLREAPYRLWRRDFTTPGLPYRITEFSKIGFIQLAENPPNEFVIGLIGRFWLLDFDIRTLDPDGFRDFARPGYAKAAANFHVEPLGPRLSNLATETRVVCYGRKAKQRFRAYWSLIRPFSGLVRREWLRLAKMDAEIESILRPGE